MWNYQLEVIIVLLVLTMANIGRPCLHFQPQSLNHTINNSIHGNLAVACVIPYKMVITSPGDYILTQDLREWVMVAVFLTFVQTVLNTRAFLVTLFVAALTASRSSSRVRCRGCGMVV